MQLKLRLLRLEERFLTQQLTILSAMAENGLLICQRVSKVEALEEIIGAQLPKE